MERLRRSKTEPLLGCHVSVAGGVHRAFERGAALDCTAVQIFTRNQRQWQAPPLHTEQVDRFLKSAQEYTRIRSVLAHGSYLVNLAADGGSARKIQLSTETLLDELNRCRMLGIPFLIVHPGSHGGDGEVSGVERVISRIESVLKRFDGNTALLIETTSGQGNGIGYRFEHVRDIIRGVHDSRLGSCIDTCHIFSAGYDIRTGKSLWRTIRKFDRVVGLEYVSALHLNDSRGALGSRVDRHTHIGAGEIGVKPFSLIMRDRQFAPIPKIIETPKNLEGQDMDVKNLDLLRSMVRTSHGGKGYSKPGKIFNVG